MFCTKCKKTFQNSEAKFCSICGEKLIQRLRVIGSPMSLDSKKKIIKVVELPDKTRQIHFFDDNGCLRPINSKDDISWEDLETASKIPMDVFLSFLFEINES